MTRIVDFIFLIFAAFLGKKALLLSVFAFAPSVLANDIPLATLSVDNIQVRAEWNMVGDSANHFSVEGGILMLTSNISAVGKPDGVTITADVEVRDKFSTLNQNYQDLITRVKITTVIMGCHDYWTGRFAKSFRQQGKSPANQIVMEDSPIKAEDVIARRNNDNGYNNVFLHTVIAISPDTSFRVIDGIRYNYSYMTTSPDLFEYLEWDSGYPDSQLGWMTLEVNESETCFAEEIETFQEQEKIQYLNANAPLISGYQARRVTVDTAFALTASQSQHFYLYDVKLGGLLPRPNFIIDNGKAFRIDNSYPIDNSRYEYVANLTVASDGYWNNDPHEVIFFYQDCPTVYEVTTQYLLNSSSILIIDLVDGSKVKTYALFDGVVYKVTDIHERSVGVSFMLEGYSKVLTGQFQIKFSDHHFLCEGYP